MLYEGLKLSVLGMGVVFFFLLLLIGVINTSTKLLADHTARELASMDAARKRGPRDRGPEQQRVVAIISAAIAAHRARFHGR